jgi:molybdenum cofactor sulfurtransferase
MIANDGVSHDRLQSLEDSYAAFLQAFPAFTETRHLDDLRATDFARLDQQRQIYLDYTGGGLYAERQLHAHLELLRTHIFGNPHSENPTSRAMTELDEQARRFVLAYFHASPDEYGVIFTPNASGALKLVGESYPFTPDGHYLLTYDNHNSVNGIRAFAHARGAKVAYIPMVSPDLRLDEDRMTTELSRATDTGHHLFAYPAQSNFSGVHHSLEWIARAQAQGWDVLVDAAAFVPSNRLDLSQWHPDFVPISFYKMFGYPTGVGCLLVRKQALQKLHRPWFAGGAIWAASVESEQVFMAEGESAFEDGTLNYLSLPAIEIGLHFLEEMQIDAIHTRVMSLAGWLLDILGKLHHANGLPLVQIYGPRDTLMRGATIALNFLDPTGHIIDERLIDRLASHQGISLRTGCFCNPGAGELAFHIPPESVVRTFQQETHSSYDAFLQDLGLPSGGAVRMSLGIVTTFVDCYRFVEFAESFLDHVPDEHDLPARQHC